MKINNRIVSSLALSIFCTSAIATAPPSLTTFGTNGIAEKQFWSNGAERSVKASVTMFNMKLLGRDFRSNMKVSNLGDVVFVDETTTHATLWRSSDNSYQYNLGNSAGQMIALDITTNGEMVLAGGSIWKYNESSRTYKYSDSLRASLAMSSDGRLGTYGINGAGTNGNNIATYPAFDTLDTNGLSFEDPYSLSTFNPVTGQQKALTPDILNKGFYEEVNLIDVNGNSEVLLSTLQHGYLAEDWQIGTDMYLNSYNFDITLMDTSGRYISSPYNVRYPVSLSNNGKVVLAYKEIEGCPSIDTITQENCAILWQVNNQVIRLGNFLPYAMSGDASIVVGRSHEDENLKATAILWDKQHGARPFIDAIAEIGIDLSAWTDIYPLDIAKDSSKIVGHGINPQGIREGFLIDWPEKSVEKWQRNEVETANTFIEKDWLTSTITDSPIQQSNQSGARITYTFDGSRIRVIGTKGLENGYFNVYIDNIFWDSFDTFDCSQTYSDIIFESDYLGEGQHTIIIEVAHRKQLASSNTNIGIDAFEIEQYSSDHLELSLKQTPSWVAYNTKSDYYSSQDPGSPFCFAYFPCRDRFFETYHYLWEATEASKPLSEILNEDGSFTVEFWIKNDMSVTHAGLLNMSGMGKFYELDLSSLVDQETLSQLTYQNLDPILYTGTGFQDVLSYKLKYSHIAVSGNWYSGVFNVYMNGKFISQASSIDNPNSEEDMILIGRPLPLSTKITATHFMFAKVAAYNEQFSDEIIKDLYEWPTHYGLSFAPNSSPEFSTRLPGCSTSCEPGQIARGLTSLQNSGIPPTDIIPVTGGL